MNKGTKLFRGSRTSYHSNTVINRRGTFYAHNRNSALLYSPYVTEYTLKNNARLLNLGNPNTIRHLMNIVASNELRYKIKKAFRLDPVNNSERRFSKLKYDAFVAELVCRLGYDGYYAPRLRTKYAEGHLAGETVLCNPQNFLNITNKYRNTNRPPSPPNLKRKRANLNRTRPNVNAANYSLKNKN